MRRLILLIFLIHKIKNPMKANDYRPISLCNVLYKITSKVLSNRLKKILSLIISPSQSAFISGRLITNNMTISYEALHTMKSRMRGKEESMALKLEISKAYDRIEWVFLETIMRNMGFGEKWIMLIISCIPSVSYSILITG